MPYATTTDLANFVQGDIAAATAQLLLDLAEDAIDGEVGGVSLEETEYTETFDDSSLERSPDGKTIWVVPPGWPLEVATVVEDGTTLTETDDYTIAVDGKIKRVSDTWGDEVEVTYTTGFVDGDNALKTARRIVLEVAAQGAANPQLLDSLATDGTNLGFRRGSTAIGLDDRQRADLRPYKWRRRMA